MWIVGIIVNKEPALVSIYENLKSIVNALDRAPKKPRNSNKVAFGNRGLADVDPEYPPKPVVISQDNTYDIGGMAGTYFSCIRLTILRQISLFPCPPSSVITNLFYISAQEVLLLCKAFCI